MPQTELTIIFSVIGGLTFVAVMATTYFVTTRRRRRAEAYRNLGRDQEQPLRIFAVQQGKVITVTESQRNVSIRGLRWPLSMYSSGTVRSASKGQSPSRRSVRSGKPRKHVANLMQEERGGQAANMDATGPASEDLSYAIPSPPEAARTRGSNEKQGYPQPPKHMPVIYDSVISDSLMKAYHGVPYPKGRRKHRQRTSTAPSSLRLSLGDRPSHSTTYHPITATGHLLEPTTPGSQMSSAVDSLSWRETMMPSRSWTQAPESFVAKANYPIPAPLTGRSSADSSINAQKNLPALPPPSRARTRPVSQISQKSILKPSKTSNKPKFDLDILQAASVSAVPPSAFNSYRSSWSNGESLGATDLVTAVGTQVTKVDSPTISVQRASLDDPPPRATKSTNRPTSTHRHSKTPSTSWISPVTPPPKAATSKPRYVPTHLHLTMKQQGAPGPAPRLSIPSRPPRLPEIIDERPSSILGRPPRLPEIIDEHDPYKDKPLPSPRSHSPSFVVSPVSPISSHFFLDQMEPSPEPKAPQRQGSPFCGHPPASAAEMYAVEAGSVDFLPPAIWRLG